MYAIHMGCPEMHALWQELINKNQTDSLSKKEKELFKKLVNALKHLSSDPKYPGLHSHEIEALTSRYGTKVFESYLENNKPAAGRIFWVYGPSKMAITVIGLEPHPNDKANSYKKITLSKTGTIV